MPAPIRENEWLKEIDRLTRIHADGFSTSDAADATGLSTRIIRERIASGIRLGLLVLAGHRTGISIDGKRSKIPVYRKVTKKR